MGICVQLELGISWNPVAKGMKGIIDFSQAKCEVLSAP